MSNEIPGWVRFLPLRDYERLKSAWRDLVKACGGLDRVAEITRAKNKSHASEYGAPHCLERFPPLDVIADLEADCGTPIVTRILADMLGFDIAAREAKPASQPLRALMARMIKETGEATSQWMEHEQDVEGLVRELRDVMDCCATLIATLTTRHTLRAVG